MGKGVCLVTLWGIAGDVLIMARGKCKLVPEFFDVDGVTYRTTSFLPSQKRSEKPEPGTLPITDIEA